MESQIDSVERGFLGRPLARGDLGLLLLAAFVIAALPALDAPASILNVLNVLAQQNLFFLLAVIVAAQRFLASSVALTLSNSDWILVAAAGLLFSIVCFIGVDQLAGLVLTILLIPLSLSTRRDVEFSSGLLVCAALAINSFWGPLIFQTFTAPIISFDTTLLKWAYNFLRPDIMVEGVTFRTLDGFGIVVVGACSVFTSASVAFLAATAISQWIKPGLRRGDIIVLAIVLVTMISINTCRLILMGWSRDYFAYWHDGGGSFYVSLAQTAVIASVATWGARWSARAPA